MSETADWPEACKFCGATGGRTGKTEQWEWIQFDCGTEYEVELGEGMWNQDDDCQIASLTAQLAAAKQKAGEAESRVAILEGELANAAEHLSRVHPIATVKHIGLREVAAAANDVVEMAAAAEARAEGLKADFNPSCVCGGSIDKPNPDCERCDLIAQLAAAKQRAGEAEPFMEALKRAHNGYDPECREVMPTLKEPATPKQAIKELLEERDGELDEAYQKLAAAEARAEGLAAAAQEVIDMNRQRAYDQYGDSERAESWSCVTVLRAALDALPALDADGRWEQEIKQLIADYQASLDRGACKGDSGEGLLRLVVMNLTQVCERASAPPAEGKERPRGEPRPDRPPMLLARRYTGMGGIWVWMTRREADWSSQWHGSDDCDYKSRDLLAIDRTASDEAALALYDADLTSGEAAQREE